MQEAENIRANESSYATELQLGATGAEQKQLRRIVPHCMTTSEKVVVASAAPIPNHNVPPVSRKP